MPLTLDLIPAVTQDRMFSADLYEMVTADPLEQAVTGVYFLVCNDEIIYIGESTNIRARVVGHLVKREHLFNRVYLLPCDVTVMGGYERTLIRALKPKGNRKFCAPILEHVIRERLGFSS